MTTSTTPSKARKPAAKKAPAPRKRAPAKPKPPPPLQPWDRQADESDQSWAAFVLYRDMGPARSTPKVARELGKSATLITRWSARHLWVLRASGYDRELDREWQAEVRLAHRTTAQRNAKIAEKVFEKVADRLEHMVMIDDIKVADIPRFLDAASKLERLALGLSTESVALTGADGGPVQTADVSLLTDEERTARMETLQRELAARLEAQSGEMAG